MLLECTKTSSQLPLDQCYALFQANFNDDCWQMLPQVIGYLAYTRELRDHSALFANATPQYMAQITLNDGAHNSLHACAMIGSTHEL